jgi:hypothetical protein
MILAVAGLLLVLAAGGVYVKSIRLPSPPSELRSQKYLDDGDVQKRAAEAHGEGRGRHNRRTGQEAHRHGERRHLVPARDDPRLQRHEQPCTPMAIRPGDSLYCSIPRCSVVGSS